MGFKEDFMYKYDSKYEKELGKLMYKIQKDNYDFLETLSKELHQIMVK
jgi:hypothetical protein